VIGSNGPGEMRFDIFPSWRGPEGCAAVTVRRLDNAADRLDTVCCLLRRNTGKMCPITALAPRQLAIIFPGVTCYCLKLGAIYSSLSIGSPKFYLSALVLAGRRCELHDRLFALEKSVATCDEYGRDGRRVRGPTYQAGRPVGTVAFLRLLEDGIVAAREQYR
jgi:hypothetical protein